MNNEDYNSLRLALKNKEFKKIDKDVSDNVSDGTFYNFKYKPKELIINAINYFKYCDKNPIEVNTFRGTITKRRPYTASGYRSYIGMGKTTYYEYLKDERYGPIMELIQDVIHNNLITGALIGEFEPRLASRIAVEADTSKLLDKMKQSTDEQPLFLDPDNE